MKKKRIIAFLMLTISSASIISCSGGESAPSSEESTSSSSSDSSISESTSASSSTSLESAGSESESKEDALGEQITKDEVLVKASTFDYAVATYFSSQNASIKIYGIAEDIAVDYQIVTAGEVAFDFSDFANYYYGFSLTNSNVLTLSRVVGEDTITAELLLGSGRGLQLDKNNDGSYVANDYSYDSTLTETAAILEEEPTSIPCDFSTIEAVAAQQMTFFYTSGMAYSGSNLVETAVTNEATEYYLSSDGVLSIKGSATQEIDMSKIGFSSLSLIYDFLLQFDSHGLICHSEYSNYRTDSEYYAVTGKAEVVGTVNEAVEHKKYCDIVKENQPSNISDSSV